MEKGLQHQDGHSHILASVIPNCVSYDPTFSYEMAVIFREGLRRMHEKNENIFYYITAMNENYSHPEMPKDKMKEYLKVCIYLKKIITKARLKFNF